MDQIFLKLHQFWQNRRRVNGIRVEYFARNQYDETSENFTRGILFMSMFNDISCGSKANEKECLADVKLVSLCAKRFGKGQWSFIGLDSENKCYCISEERQFTRSMGQYG